MENKNTLAQKKKREFPSSIVIIFLFIILSMVGTWLIPSGQYDRILNEATGRMVVDPDSFHYVDNIRVGVFQMFQAFSQGIQDAGWVVVMILLIGGGLEIVLSTKSLDNLLGAFAQKTQKYGIIMVPVTIALFSIFGCVVSLQEIYIAFGILMITFARAMGFDALTGCIMLSYGQMIGFISGEFNAFAVGTAQGIIGLPMYSGLGYRLVIHVILLVITLPFFYHYAKKIHADPSKSLCYEQELAAKAAGETGADMASYKVNGRQKIILILLLAGIVFIAYASVTSCVDLYTATPAVFLIVGLISGIIYGYSANEICALFIKGCGNMIVGALIVGLSRAVSVILDWGVISDTIIYAACNALAALPKALTTIGIYIFTAILNFINGSGSGKAALLMPILSPMADILEIRQQLLVIAYSFGDGITNLLSPMNPLVMVPLGMAGVGYGQWIKATWKPTVVMLVAAIPIIVVLSAMNIGPF